MEFKKHPNRTLRHTLSIPFIYMMIIPVIILDIFLEVYHRICFPLYGLKYVKRTEYIKLDRHKLAYLSFREKINCTYCGYVNGFAHYFMTIAGETEKYWCGIKHKESNEYKMHPHHDDFIEYGNEKEFKKKYCKLGKKNRKN
ncbi:MAG: hypothetical protein WC758_00455 [Candidatus Woesearchaeota archaeon]|jgi:hypothetical protein